MPKILNRTFLSGHLIGVVRSIHNMYERAYVNANLFERVWVASVVMRGRGFWLFNLIIMIRGGMLFHITYLAIIIASKTHIDGNIGTKGLSACVTFWWCGISTSL